MKDTLRQLAVKFNFSNTFKKITNEFIACAIDCYPFITSLGEFMKWISRNKTVNRNDTFVLDKGEVTRWSMRRITLRLLELVEGLRWHPSTTWMFDTGSLDRKSRL